MPELTVSSEFAVDPDSGLIRPARQCPSPNCDARPDGTVPDTVIIHGISLPPGEFGGEGIEKLFTNCLDTRVHPCFEALVDLRVSAHLLIRRDGSVIQFVPFNEEQQQVKRTFKMR